MLQGIERSMKEQSQAAIDDLIAGYRRFLAKDWAEQKGRWSELAEGQAPRTMVISCSDSRVDPAQIFDVDPGTIFVVRNVAALVPPFETTAGQHGVSAALEFAVQVLKVEEVMVLGHGMCGGCNASLTQAMAGKPVGEGQFVGHWVSLLDEKREEIAAKYGTESREAQFQMELAAVKVSLTNLLTFPFVKDKVDAGSLALRGAHFAISDGILRVLDRDREGFDEVT